MKRAKEIEDSVVRNSKQQQSNSAIATYKAQRMVLHLDEILKEPNILKRVVSNPYWGEWDEEQQSDLLELLISLHKLAYYKYAIHPTNEFVSANARRLLNKIRADDREDRNTNEKTPSEIALEFPESIKGLYPKAYVYLSKKQRNEEGKIIWDEQVKDLAYIISKLPDRPKRYEYYSSYFVTAKGDKFNVSSLTTSANKINNGSSPVPDYLRELFDEL